MPNNYFSNYAVDEDFYQKISTLCPEKPGHLRILMVGDVMGRPGRKTIKSLLPSLRKNLSLDFISINGENLAGGFGITEKIVGELKECGVDAFTMGNHWKDKPDIHKLFRDRDDIVLPHNLKAVSDCEKVPSFYLETKKKHIHVVNLMGRFAMRDEYNNPYQFLENLLPQMTDHVAAGFHTYIVDFHAEASSEKQAAVWQLDGVAAALVGTHTHVATADERITSRGTAFLTDVGMSGPYDSVIGMKKDLILRKFLEKGPRPSLEVADQDLWFSGFFIDVNAQGRAHLCARLQCRLQNDHQHWFYSGQCSGTL